MIKIKFIRDIESKSSGPQKNILKRSGGRRVTIYDSFIEPN